MTYLRDETGGRRFWPITCGRIEVEALARDRDQLWAEAKTRFDAGFAWWLGSAALVRLATDEQTERYEGDPWEEVIGRWAEDRANVSISEVLERCLQKPQGLWTQSGQEPHRPLLALSGLGAISGAARDAFSMEISPGGGIDVPGVPSLVPSRFPVSPAIVSSRSLRSRFPPLAP
jgi:hypothetical protein